MTNPQSAPTSAASLDHYIEALMNAAPTNLDIPSPPVATAGALDPASRILLALATPLGDAIAKHRRLQQQREANHLSFNSAVRPIDDPRVNALYNALIAAREAAAHGRIRPCPPTCLRPRPQA